MVIGLFPVFIFTILGMVAVEMAQLNTSVMLTPFTSAPTLTLEAMTQPLFSNHQASSFWPSTALTSTSSSEKGSHTSMMRVRKDSSRSWETKWPPRASKWKTWLLATKTWSGRKPAKCPNGPIVATPKQPGIWNAQKLSMKEVVHLLGTFCTEQFGPPIPTSGPQVLSLIYFFWRRNCSLLCLPAQLHGPLKGFLSWQEGPSTSTQTLLPKLQRNKDTIRCKDLLIETKQKSDKKEDQDLELGISLRLPFFSL